MCTALLNHSFRRSTGLIVHECGFPLKSPGPGPGLRLWSTDLCGHICGHPVVSPSFLVSAPKVFQVEHQTLKQITANMQLHKLIKLNMTCKIHTFSWDSVSVRQYLPVHRLLCKGLWEKQRATASVSAVLHHCHVLHSDW